MPGGALRSAQPSGTASVGEGSGSAIYVRRPSIKNGCGLGVSINGCVCGAQDAILFGNVRVGVGGVKDEAVETRNQTLRRSELCTPQTRKTLKHWVQVYSKQNNVAVLLALKKDMVKTYRNDKKVYNLVRACTCGIVVFV